MGEGIMKKFLRNEQGGTAIEYALIASVISMVIIGGATIIGTEVSEPFVAVADIINP
jgi:pilus assembly protein Flp/PilA